MALSAPFTHILGENKEKTRNESRLPYSLSTTRDCGQFGASNDPFGASITILGENEEKPEMNRVAYLRSIKLVGNQF